MYIRIAFGERGDIAVWSEKEIKNLPFESVAKRWRQELYFELPAEIAGEETLTVERGDVAYWRQGRAICLFHGFSQPYGPVVKLGAIVGNPDLLSSVEDETPVRGSELVDYGREGGIAKALRDAGFKAASHSWEGEEMVGVLVEGAGVRVGVEIIVEETGFHTETQPIAFLDHTPPSLAFYRVLARELMPTGIRPDVNDEGYLVLTCYSRDFNELTRDLRRLLSAHTYVEKAMETFYAVRRPA